MISSISNASLLPTALQITNQAVAKASGPSTQKPQAQAEDTVHLSPQALAAAHDMDHDGDSH